MANVYDFTVKDRKGNEVNLGEYAGKVLLIVNTATGCGFTPHYDPLEAMYKDLREYPAAVRSCSDHKSALHHDLGDPDAAQEC